MIQDWNFGRDHTVVLLLLFVWVFALLVSAESLRITTETVWEKVGHSRGCCCCCSFGFTYRIRSLYWVSAEYFRGCILDYIGLETGKQVQVARHATRRGSLMASTFQCASNCGRFHYTAGPNTAQINSSKAQQQRTNAYSLTAYGTSVLN